MTFYTLRLEQDELTRVIVENSHKEQVISDIVMTLNHTLIESSNFIPFSFTII